VIYVLEVFCASGYDNQTICVCSMLVVMLTRYSAHEEIPMMIKNSDQGLVDRRRQEESIVDRPRRSQAKT